MKVIHDNIIIKPLDFTDDVHKFAPQKESKINEEAPFDYDYYKVE